jgi:hypothetical protein
MSSAQARAVRPRSQPTSTGSPEKPYPGQLVRHRFEQAAVAAPRLEEIRSAEAALLQQVEHIAVDLWPYRLHQVEDKAVPAIAMHDRQRGVEADDETGEPRLCLKDRVA